MASQDERNLRKLQKQLVRIVAQVQREVASRVKLRAQVEATELFAAQQYVGPSGRAKRLGPIKADYRKAKVAAGYDPRRGHRTGKLARAINQMVKLDPSRKSIMLNLPAAARRTGAAAYLDFYEEAKAPGLGGRISRRLEDWWKAEIAKRLRQRIRAIIGPVQSYRRFNNKTLNDLLAGRAKVSLTPKRKVG